MTATALALLGAIVAKVLADEVKELMIWLPAKLIRLASKQFPPESRARIEEEWLAHCNDLPGNLSKLWHALGCISAAVRLTYVVSRVILTILFIPLFEAATPFCIVMLVILNYLGMLRGTWPERVRVQRIRKAAGGLDVLGLSDLHLIPSDHYPEERRLAIRARLGVILEVGTRIMGRLMERYLRLWPRLERLLFD